MNLKKSIIIGITMLLVLVGCSGATTEKKTLVLYSNSVSDGRGDWLKAEAKLAGFEIEYVDIGGGELANRLIAEKNNPIADVVFGLNSMGFSTLKENAVLDKYVPTWSDEITPGLNDPEGYYHALVKQAILLIYNPNVFTEETAPKDWVELGNTPAFKQQYFIEQKLSGGTIRAVIAGILTRYQDPNGELGISDKGWEELTKFYENGYINSGGEDFFASFAEEKTPIGVMWSSGLKTREEKFNITAGIANPTIGVPYVVEQISLVSGSKNVENAKAFIDWFGSADVQTKWSQEFYQLPANEKAAVNAPEEIRNINETVKKQDIDWEFVAENMEKWVEKIELEIIPA